MPSLNISLHTARYRLNIGPCSNVMMMGQCHDHLLQQDTSVSHDAWLQVLKSSVSWRSLAADERISAPYSA
jgi:hypothetical protein